jgi:hypothetical protein
MGSRTTFPMWSVVLTSSRCGEDIRSLQRFVNAQCTAFRKILKKYSVCRPVHNIQQQNANAKCQKWTGSRALCERFNSEVLGDPRSFTRRDFEPLFSKFNDLITNLREYTPDGTDPATPTTRSRRASLQISDQPAPQAYWNEYDNGSEAQDEPYTIYINPDAEPTFPGAATIMFLFSKAMVLMEKVKVWLGPVEPPSEQRPLLGDENVNTDHMAEHTETEVEDEAYASSGEFPPGYAIHHATFASVNDQKLFREREKFILRGQIATLVASALLTLIAGILVATGKHRLRVEVDAGVITGVVSSFFFAVLGFSSMLYHAEQLGWVYRTCYIFLSAVICVANACIGALIVTNT